MKQQIDPAVDAVTATLDRELNLVRDAIAMVTSGWATRVVLGGLRFGDKLLAPAREIAARAGVRIVPLWPADESGADLAVEREGDA